MEFTFEQLPNAISQLYNKLDSIEKLILAKSDHPQEEADQLMTIEEAAVFAHLSKATLYGLVSRSGVPCMKKGKRLYFSRQELTGWIKAGRKKTVSEIAAETDSYLTRKAR